MANSPFPLVRYNGFTESIYPLCSHVEHRASMNLFVSLQYVNLGRTLWMGDQPDARPLSTHKHSVRAGEYISCTRPRGHCDRPGLLYGVLLLWSKPDRQLDTCGRKGEITHSGIARNIEVIVFPYSLLSTCAHSVERFRCLLPWGGGGDT
jgi:hypothetical protein